MTQAGITPPATVCLLCNCTEPRLSDLDAKFFEPGCGDGNFLAEILTRRLQKITYSSSADFQNKVLLAVANLYGVDIRSSAILEVRHRLQSVATNFISQYFQPDYRFTPLLEQILEQNFIIADLLRDRSKIFFPYWQKIRDYEFTIVPTIWPMEAA